jgi:hypothetical protein
MCLNFVCKNDDETSKNTESENVIIRWIIINIIIQNGIEQISELMIYISLQTYAWFWKYESLQSSLHSLCVSVCTILTCYVMVWRRE